MKDATGELNMTVIVIVGIAAIAAFFTVFILPNLKVTIATNQCRSECGDKDWQGDDAWKTMVKDDNPAAVCDCNVNNNNNNP